MEILYTQNFVPFLFSANYFLLQLKTLFVIAFLIFDGSKRSQLKVKIQKNQSLNFLYCYNIFSFNTLIIINILIQNKNWYLELQYR